MEIFQQEELDGVGDFLRGARRVVAWTAPARATKGALITPSRSLDRAIGTNLNQHDLHYLEAVLVSAGYALDPSRGVPLGWNNNDHVFDPLEVWAARSTPEDKPFNLGHDCSDIIGHITDCKAETFAGDSIDGSATTIPDAFNLVTGAVLYKVWADAELQERMDRILAEIPEEKWHVSMECLYRGFDFCLLSKSGEVEVVKRSRETAHLTKHLRICRGGGEYQGKRLGMVLRDLTFSGKGLVENPANPHSVIRAANAEKTQIHKTTVYFPAEPTEPNMDETLKNENERLKAGLAAAQAELEKARAALQAGDQAKLQEATEARKAAEAALASERSARAEADRQVKAEVEKLVAEKAALETKVAETTAEVAALKADRAKAERLAKVTAALKLDADRALKMVESLTALDDAAFAAHVDVLATAITMTPGSNNAQPGNTTFPHGSVTVLQTPATNLGVPGPSTGLPTHKPAVAANTADPGVLDRVVPDATPAAAVPTPASAPEKGRSVRLAIASMFGYKPETEDATGDAPANDTTVPNDQ